MTVVAGNNRAATGRSRNRAAGSRERAEPGEVQHRRLQVAVSGGPGSLSAGLKWVGPRAARADPTPADARQARSRAGAASVADTAKGRLTLLHGARPSRDGAHRQSSFPRHTG